MPTLLQRWTWPALCEICARWPAQPVCDACVADHAGERPRCPGCALPLAPGLDLCIRCVEQPGRHLASSLARVDYAYPWVDVIAQFKFQAQPAWARTLAPMMAELPAAQHLLVSVDLVAPIPLPPARLRERGYNQAWELVKQLHKQTPTGLDARPDLLLRAESRHTQHSLPRDERFEHARRAFTANPIHAQDLQHAQVLLVDDVMTTGATARECAGVLRQAGAASVEVAVLGRA